MKAKSIIEAVFGSPSDFYGQDEGDHEQIVAAAIRDQDGSIYLGDHHAMASRSREQELTKNPRKWESFPEEGFYTNKGRFLSREDALELSKSNRQMQRKDRTNYRDDYLDSFDLLHDQSDAAFKAFVKRT